jgi:hypothetical protein
VTAGHDLVPPWIALAVYAAGFVITARVYFATADYETGSDTRVAAAVLGLIWPAALIGFAIMGLLALPTLGVKTRAQRREEAVTAEWERGKRDTRIADLEAENDRLRQLAGGEDAA